MLQARPGGLTRRRNAVPTQQAFLGAGSCALLRRHRSTGRPSRVASVDTQPAPGHAGTHHHDITTTTTTSTLLPHNQQQQEPHAGVDPASGRQPAGRSHVWTRHWWPVLPIDYLDPTRPTPIKILGRDLVIWQDGSGSWRVFRDACPHRLAPLSEGRVEKDGTLACSYHGWRFNSSGTCTVVPQAENEAAAKAACSNKRACATSYPTRVAYGLLWVWPDEAPTAEADAAAVHPVADAPQQEFDRKGGKLHWLARDLPFPYEHLVENVTDPAHLPFSHHKTFGGQTREVAGAMPMRPLRVETAPKGVHAAAASGEAAGAGAAPEVAGAMPMRPLRVETAARGAGAGAAGAAAGARAGAGAGAVATADTAAGAGAATHAAAKAGAAAGAATHAAEGAEAQQPPIPQPLFTEQLPLHLSPDTRFSFYPPAFVTAHFNWTKEGVGSDHTHFYCIPVKPGVSRVVHAGFSLSSVYKVTLSDVVKAIGSPLFRFVFFRYLYTNALPVWFRHLSVNHAFDQDSVFLYFQAERLRSASMASSSSAPSPAHSVSSTPSTSSPASTSSAPSSSSSITTSTAAAAAAAASSATHPGSAALSNLLSNPNPNPQDWARHYYMPVSCDRGIIQAKRWIDAAGGPFGSGNGLAPEHLPKLTKRQILDRYDNHTKFCPHCRGMSERLDRTLASAPMAGGSFLLALGALLCTFGVQGLAAGGAPAVVAVAAAVGMLVCFAAHRFASKLRPRFHFVDWSHADHE